MCCAWRVYLAARPLPLQGHFNKRCERSGGRTFTEIKHHNPPPHHPHTMDSMMDVAPPSSSSAAAHNHPLPPPLLRLPRDVLLPLVQTYCDQAMRRSLYRSCTALHALILQATTTLTLRWAHDLTEWPVPLCAHTRPAWAKGGVKSEEEARATHTPACFPLRAACTRAEDMTRRFVPRLFAWPAVDGWRHFQHLQTLEVWDAGTLFPPLADALFHVPLPALTHLLLHTASTPATAEAMVARHMLGDPPPEEEAALAKAWLASPRHFDFHTHYLADHESRGEMPLLPLAGRRLGEVWRKGHLPKLQTLGLRNLQVEGEFLAALLEGAGWWRRSSSSISKEEEEALVPMPALVALDLGGTDMGQQGSRALAAVFQRQQQQHTAEEQPPPLRALSMGWWGDDDTIVCGEAIDRRTTVPTADEEEEDVADGGGESLLGRILCTPACGRLESLGLDECVALTPEELVSFTRFLTKGYGRCLRELRLTYLLEYRWSVVAPETELMLALARALVGVAPAAGPGIGPSSFSSFSSPCLQVVELSGCRLQGEPIRCLAEGLGRDCWPALQKLRLPAYNVDRDDMAALMHALGGGRKAGEPYTQTARSMRVLEWTGADPGMEEFVTDDVFHAFFAGLTMGACPCLEELALCGDAMTDDVLELGLCRGIQWRSEPARDSDLGPAAPYLGTLQILQLRHTSLSSDGVAVLYQALQRHKALWGLEKEEGRRRRSLYGLRELILDQETQGEGNLISSFIGDEGVHFLTAMMPRHLPALEILSLEDCDLHHTPMVALEGLLRVWPWNLEKACGALALPPGTDTLEHIWEFVWSTRLKEVRLGMNFRDVVQEVEEEEEEEEEEDSGGWYGKMVGRRRRREIETTVLRDLLATVERRNEGVREWNALVQKTGAAKEWLVNECRIEY